ncbi:transmembrane protein, putative (macronuclear) [Tetrahymena thermophila SB210]|uniref:Transmembrane protein, putative n=1 Tax=Tetrahymena thermophila (strain SB210) TaxID=312017 RepID=I7MHH4_TETTS|nr:transmembrane protein, putative [Tetrahymena thermophila SB210]EAR87539.2 transmembrane protein, putative [Tetrahymena thermophila SB210]|eukprot:XP_001007784.2 transmembrane protein, putative [Tetrahymena thermophila SB210]
MVNKEFLLGETERKRFIKDYIIEIFEKYLDKNNQNLSTVHLEYFFFLHDYVNNPTKAIILLHNTENQQQKEATNQQLALLSYIKQMLQKDYLINQQQYYKDKLQSFDMQKVLDYDDKLKDFQKKLCSALEKKRDFLSEISKDTINLQNVYIDGQKLISARKQLHKDLVWLYQVNSINKLQEKMLDIYINNLSFGDFKGSYYRKQRKYQSKTDIDLFNENQCVVFISLLKGSLGEIKRVSDSFQNIFDVPPSEVLNKNCSILMQNSIGKYHNDFLQQMIDRGYISQNRTNYFKILFGVTKQDFVIPLDLNIKLDYINQREFGVSAIVKSRNSSDQNYIILEGTDNFKIQNMTENLFNNLFKRFISKEEINKVYLDQFVPIISGFIKAKMREEKYSDNTSEQGQHLKFHFLNILKEEQFLDTICFFPIQNIKYRLFNKLEDIEKQINDSQLFSITENEIYQIRIEVSFLQNQNINQCYVQIKNFRQVKRLSDKKAELHTWSQQMKKYCGVKYNFENVACFFKASKLLQTKNYFHHDKQNSEVQNQNSVKLLQVEKSVLYNEENVQNIDNQLQADQKDLSNLLQEEHSSSESVQTQLNTQQKIDQEDQEDSHSKQSSSNSHSLSAGIIESNIQNDKNKKSIFSQQEIQMSTQIIQLMSEQNEILSNRNIILPNNNQSQIKHLSINSQKLLDIPEKIQLVANENKDLKYQQIELIPLSPKSPFASYRVDQSALSHSNLISPTNNHSLLKDINDDNFHKVKKISDVSTSLFGSQINKELTKELKPNLAQELHIHNLIQHQKQQSTIKQENTDEDSKNEKYQASTHSFNSIQMKLMRVKNQIRSKFQAKEKRRSTKMTKLSQKFESESETSKKNQQTKKFEKDQSSIASLQDNQFYAKKQFLIEKIKSQKYSKQLKLINAFSLISLITIILISIYFFWEIISSFNEQNKNFSYIPWTFRFRTTMSTAIKDTNLRELTQNNALMNGIPDVNGYHEIIVSRLSKNLQDMRGYIQQYMNDEKINFQSKQYIISTQATLLAYTTLKQYRNITEFFGYSLQMYQLIMFQFSNQIYYNGVTELNVYNNFVNITNWLSGLQNITVNSNQNYYDTINHINLTLLIINCSLCFFISISIIFLYGFLQQEKEKILSLIATVDYNYIRDMYFSITFSLKEIMKKNYSTNYNQEIQFSQKKKQISQTTSLPKYKFKIILISTVFLIMVSIYPFIQYITSKGYIDQNNVNVQLINQLYSVQAQYLSNMTAHIAYILEKLLPTIRVAPISLHYARILQLQKQNGPILQGLSNSIKNLSGNISYKESDYNSFLFQILNLNACQPFQEQQYQQYKTSQIDFNLCNTLFNGILQQGLQISSVKLFSTFDNLIDIYNIKDDTKCKEALTNFMIQLGSLKALDDMYQVMNNIILALNNFVNAMNDDYFNLNYFVQEILMIYQFALFIILYIFIWIPFQQSIQKDLTKSKIILSNFEVSYLIENPYIMNFLKKY